MPKDYLLPRLLKKVQMQGAAPIFDEYPPRGTHRRWVGGVLSAYVAAPRECGGTHRRWVTVDGPFPAAW